MFADCLYLVFQFEVVTRLGTGGFGSGSGSGSASGSGSKMIDGRLHELIAVKVTRGILDLAAMIFGTIKEGIIELKQERFKSFRADIVARQFWTQAPLFQEFKVCGATEFLRAKDPIASRCLIAYMENAQHRSFCPEGEKVGFASCLLRDKVQDWWEKFTREVG